MPRRPLPSRIAAGMVAGLLAAAGLAPGAAAISPTASSATSSTAPVDDDAPLAVSIDSLTPGALPRRGPIVVEGSVTNTSDETWTDLTLYPFANRTAAMTTSAELVEAAATSAATVVGVRILTVEDEVADLDPGESARYRLRVPRRALDLATPGIYWFGVHALGSSESTPSDQVADGRARTFLPYLPQTRGSVKTAVVVPLRARIDHTVRGAVAREDVWRTSVSADGTLSDLVTFGAAAGHRPMSWLVDPAVPDTVQQLADGNRIRSVQPTVDPAEAPSISPSATPSDDEGDGDEGDEGDEGEDGGRTPDLTALAARAWLESTRQALRDEEVLSLPYGDIDLAAAAVHSPALYGQARNRTGHVLSRWDQQTTPAATSPSGYLSEAAIDAIDDQALVLLTNRMFDETTFPEGAPTVTTVGGRRALVTSYAASTGGPGPEPRTEGVALRQRVLSEAALRMLGDREPLVVVVPPSVSAAGADQFWQGLDVDWVDLTTAGDAARGPSTVVPPSRLSYSDRQAGLELDPWIFDEVDDLVDRGNTLQNLLTLNNTIGSRLTEEALTSVSYSQRSSTEETTSRLRDSQAWVEKRLQAVEISAPPGVTLSSDSGAFVVTVSNRLKQPVTVLLSTESDEDVRVDPVDPVRIAPGTRTAVQLDTHTRGLGVHNVKITLTDSDGDPLGATAVVPVRSGQVSKVIWVIIGTGAGILFVAIAIRLYRRFHGKPTDDTDTTAADTTATATATSDAGSTAGDPGDD